jgi:hypothetical protein
MAAATETMGDSESLAIFDYFTWREVGYFVMGIASGIALTMALWEVDSIRKRGTSRFFGECGDLIWDLVDVDTIRASILRQAAAVVILTIMALPLAMGFLLWDILYASSSIILLYL